MATATLSSINSGLIDLMAAQEPSWLASIRKQAFSQYQSLPSEVSPLYSKYSDVNKIRPESIHFTAQTQARPSVLSKDLTDRLEELEQETGILQVGQEINNIFIRDSVAKQGVILSGVKDALSKHSDLIRSHMGVNQLNYLEDKFLALEGSAFQSGIFIYIPRNTILEEPIRIITSLADDGTSLISRNIVVADSGSKATVVQEIYA
ncbi:MAG: Fe-S cluster assembly protein SufD, partial [Thermoproteota archaeon]|nr:Fe-S cluster assembly protein SufD [Thermoproteota archaeon]